MTENDLINAILSGDSNYILDQAKTIDESHKYLFADISLKYSKEIRRLWHDSFMHEKEFAFNKIQQWLKKKQKGRNCAYLTNHYKLHHAAEVAMVSFCKPEQLPKDLFSDITGQYAQQEREYYENNPGPHEHHLNGSSIAVVESERARLISLAMRQRSTEWKHHYFSLRKLDPYTAIDWKHFWIIMNEGKTPRPETPAYYDYFITHSHMAVQYSRGCSVDIIREYLPAIENDLWSIFKINHPFALCPRNPLDEDERGMTARFDRWYEVIYQLEKSNEISRARLIDECFNGMQRPLSNNTLSYIVIFIEGLDLTLEEIQLRQQQLLNICKSSKGKVFDFACNQLLTLAKKQILNSNALISQVETILTQSKLTQTKKLLRILDLIQKETPSLREAINKQLLATKNKVTEKGVAEYLLERINQNSSLADNSKKANNIAQHTLSSDNIDITPSSPHYTTLINANHKKLSDIGITITHSDKKKLLLTLTPQAFSRSLGHVLSNDTSLSPVNHLGDIIKLIDTSSEDTLWDKELIFDGLQRLYNQPRTSNIIDIQRQSHEKTLLSWLQEARTFFNKKPKDATDFDQQLRHEQTQFTLHGHCAPALSLPTHQRGWIDPRKLVERIKQWRDKQYDLIEKDVILALLRLAPDFRQQALIELPTATDRYDHALAWALGCDTQPAELDDSLLWLAASQARHAYTEDTTTPAKIELTTGITPPNHIEGIYENRLLITLTHTPRHPTTYQHLPGHFVRHQFPYKWYPIYHSTYDLLRSHSYLFTDEHDYWMMLINYLCADMDNGAKYIIDHIPLLEPLFEPQRPVNDVMCIAILLCLFAKHSRYQQAGIDIIDLLISEERFDDNAFSNILAILITNPIIKLSRLAPPLTKLSEKSALHAFNIGKLLENTLTTIDSYPKGTHHLFEIAHMLAASHQYRFTENSIKKLMHNKPSGKIAGLLKKIASAAPSDPQAMRQLTEQRIRIRMARIGFEH